MYYAQDIPNKIAFINFSRLIKLAFQTSPISKYVPVVTPKKFTRVQWTAEEHQLLLRRVLEAQVTVDLIENINIMVVDWDGIAASMNFGERTGKNLREQFQRTIFPALVDELEPRSILNYRQNLLTAIRDQGAHSRQQIDWAQLQGMFWPKTRAILVGFSSLQSRSLSSYDLKKIILPVEGKHFPPKSPNSLKAQFLLVISSRLCSDCQIIAATELQ